MAVQGGDADLTLCNLSVEVPRHEALTQQFYAVHPFAGKSIHRIDFWPGLDLDAAPAVVPAPSSPERPPEAP